MIDILIFILFAGTTGKIQGTVNDADNGAPITGANVIITGTGIGTATDDNGYFAILNLPPGSYDVEVSCIGYETQKIKKVLVQIDKSARLGISLQLALIEMPPVSVIYKQKAVEKDWTSTTYIIRKEEIRTLPIDYTTGLIQFQPSVTRMDTTLHVRGGRPTEVAYLIDNVSIIDPLTGEPVINLSKSVVDEIIFLPGSFDAEYGRAMSGVVNVITQNPSGKIRTEASGKSERIMPMYYDFGYNNVQATMHLPEFFKSKTLVSLDIMHTDDQNPRLVLLPHKQRDDYALYGKWLMAPSGKLRISLSGAQSHSQFDRYDGFKWLFHLDRYRSDLKKGNLQTFNLNFLPDSRKLLNLTLSRLYSRFIYGVRIYKDYGIFDDFAFKDNHNLEFSFASGSLNNPFGTTKVYKPYDCDYPEYRERTSQVLKANVGTILNLHEYHEIKGGFEYTYNILDNFTYWVSNDTINPIVDEWNYKPDEFAAYLQDNIDYKGLYAKVGCRWDYFNSKLPNVDPKSMISPRLGFSFLVTEKFLFRTNVGRYTQPPLYDYMYSYYLRLPYPEWVWYLIRNSPIGNPNLGSEKTINYEVGCQGTIRKNMNITCNAFYKDIQDLTGTRIIVYEAHTYSSYFNVEYSNVKGIETILDYSNSLFTGKASYTLSWAKGTSSYAREIHDDYWRDTTYVPSADAYDLDFDQRHRILAQGTFNLPLAAKLHVFGYIGYGFPYASPGTEGKITNAPRSALQKQIDCIIVAPIKRGSFTVKVLAEIVNLLDIRYEYAPYSPIIQPGAVSNYNYFMTLDSPYYHPAIDFNHDGIITPYEEYCANREMCRYVNTQYWAFLNSAPRRARIGISINF
ncbi:MAG TPA: TonB-dependent receptor [bacterium]